MADVLSGFFVFVSSCGRAGVSVGAARRDKRDGFAPSRTQRREDRSRSWWAHSSAVCRLGSRVGQDDGRNHGDCAARAFEPAQRSDGDGDDHADAAPAGRGFGRGQSSGFVRDRPKLAHLRSDCGGGRFGHAARNRDRDFQPSGQRGGSAEFSQHFAQQRVEREPRVAGGRQFAHHREHRSAARSRTSFGAGRVSGSARRHD